MTFAELVGSTTWAKVSAALQRQFPDERGNLSDYHKVFRDLRRMNPTPDAMRIAIVCESIPGDDEVPVPEVVGRDGTLNRDLDDFKYLGERATAEYGAEETRWSLSLRPWRSWLGMTVEPTTLEEYLPAEVIAHCLNDMTFHGFSEAGHREFSEELERRVAEIDAMSEEERAQRLIPAERVIKRLKEKYGSED